MVQVSIGPRENRLDRIMQAAQGHRARNQDAPPDGRTDAN